MQQQQHHTHSTILWQRIIKRKRIIVHFQTHSIYCICLSAISELKDVLISPTELGMQQHSQEQQILFVYLKCLMI